MARFRKPKKKRPYPHTGCIGIRSDWKSRGSIGTSLVRLSPTQMRTHMHVLGSTGCGKTTLIHHLISQDIAQRHSFVVLDLRGDLVNAAVELCESQIEPERVKIIDLREKNRPFGFNPLAGDGESYYRALSVLDAVAHESESWGVQLSETLRNALLLLAVCGKPLTNIEAIFHDRRFRSECLSKVRFASLRDFWLRYDELSVDRQAALAMPVLNKVSLLFATETLRRVLGHETPISLASHLNTPGSVTLISLAADELHGAGRMMGNMILASICREIFSRVGIPESQRNPVRLYVDEFENFEMELFESILSEGRRFGFSVVLSHQTLAQLTPRVRSIVLNNVGTKMVFRVGREDSAYMSKDVFGDLQAMDFTNLAPGRALLWLRGVCPVDLEVNEPLFRDVGVRSLNARRYLDAVYAHAGKPPSFETTSSPPAPTVETVVEGPFGESLEDWL